MLFISAPIVNPRIDRSSGDSGSASSLVGLHVTRGKSARARACVMNRTKGGICDKSESASSPPLFSVSRKGIPFPLVDPLRSPPPLSVLLSCRKGILPGIWTNRRYLLFLSSARDRASKLFPVEQMRPKRQTSILALYSSSLPSFAILSPSLNRATS